MHLLHFVSDNLQSVVNGCISGGVKNLMIDGGGSYLFKINLWKNSFSIIFFSKNRQFGLETLHFGAELKF